jgi:acyl-CoA thioester hydrolase
VPGGDRSSTLAAVLHEKRIEIRWRDCDAYGHVNNAVYATYLEEARDEWVLRVLGEAGDVWDYVLARLAIDFRRELTLDHDVVRVTAELVRIGTSSVVLRERITTRDGELAAEAESVLVARDRETGRSRPLTEAERTAFHTARAAD